jgi:hypothetical protein
LNRTGLSINSSSCRIHFTAFRWLSHQINDLIFCALFDWTSPQLCSASFNRHFAFDFMNASLCSQWPTHFGHSRQTDCSIAINIDFSGLSHLWHWRCHLRRCRNCGRAPMSVFLKIRKICKVTLTSFLDTYDHIDLLMVRSLDD